MSQDALAFNLDDLIKAQNDSRTLAVEADKVKTERTVAGQEVATRTAARTIGVLSQARDIGRASDASQAKNVEAQRYLMGDVAELAAIEQEAIQLSNSGKPADKLTLWMKQISDPRYTMAYNQSRRNNATNTSDTMNHFEAIRQDAYKSQLAAITQQAKFDEAQDSFSLLPLDQKLELAELSKTQGETAVKSLTDAITQRHTMLAQNNAMQENTIMNLTDDQVRQAQGAAKESKDGSTNIGGVTLKLGVLDAAAAVRDDRAYMLANRELEAKDKEAARTRLVASDARQALADQRANEDQDRQNRIDNENVAKQRRTRYLGTMSPAELNRLILDGGMMTYVNGDKEAYDLDEIKKVYGLKKDAQDTDIASRAQLAGISEDGGRNIVKEHADFFATVPSAQPGSDLWNAQYAYRTTIGMSAQMLNMYSTKDDKESQGFFDANRIAYDAMQTARNQYETAIDKEAKRVGAGNAFRTEQERARLHGQPLSSDIIEAEVINRALSSKSVTDLLGSEASAAFIKTYQAKLGEIQQREFNANPGGLGGAPDRKLMQEEAATFAYDQVVKSGGDRRAAALMPLQVMEASHPLFNKATPTVFAALESDADQQGVNEFMSAFGLSANDMKTMEAGGKAKNGMTKDDLGGILVYQQSALFSRIASAYGLDTATEFANWWGSPNGAKFIQKQMDMVTSQASDVGGQEYTTSSATLPRVADNLGLYARSVQAGNRDFMNDRIVRETANFRGFGNDPSQMQMALLTQDTTLQDADRQEIYKKWIAPLIQVTKQQGMDFITANDFIEKSMRSMTPNPDDKALYKKFLRQREDVVIQIGTVVKSQTDFLAGTPNAPLGGATAQQPGVIYSPRPGVGFPGGPGQQFDRTTPRLQELQGPKGGPDWFRQMGQ